MRIEQSDVQLSADSWLSTTEERRQRIAISAPSTSGAPEDSAVISSGGTRAASDPMADPGMQLLLWAAEMIVGHMIHLFHLPQQGGSSGPSGAATPTQGSPQPAHRTSQAAPRVQVTTIVRHTEAEHLIFRAQGTVNTSDGRQISFHTELTMARASVQVNTGNGKSADPLVVNFDGAGVRLLPDRVAFDLNADGQPESVPRVAPGSGLLFADRNGDGVANNGTELFGPHTGDGFSELAVQDADHNSWIDEGDPLFSQLRVWVQDPSGRGKVYSLSDLGIGAIDAAPVATPFQLRSAANESLGQIRSSGIYLTENGQAGVIQQADFNA